MTSATSSASTRRRGTRTRSSTEPGRSDSLNDLHELEPPADLRRHARPLQEGRQGRDGRQEQAGHARDERPDAARQRRAADDAELRRLAAAAVTDLGGGVKVFAGQRDDPFYVDLGSIFDLGGLRPFNPFHLIPLPAGPGVDALKNYNTHSIELQVPISQLTDVEHPTIGIYASASRQKETVLKDDGTKDGHGPWVQVSRLGNPLDQRGRDPARAEGLLEPLGARGRRAVRGSLHEPRARRRSSTCSTALRLRRVIPAARCSTSTRRAAAT